MSCVHLKQYNIRKSRIYICGRNFKEEFRVESKSIHLNCLRKCSMSRWIYCSDLYKYKYRTGRWSREREGFFVHIYFHIILYYLDILFDLIFLRCLLKWKARELLTYLRGGNVYHWDVCGYIISIVLLTLITPLPRILPLQHTHTQSSLTTILIN